MIMKSTVCQVEAAAKMSGMSEMNYLHQPCVSVEGKTFGTRTTKPHHQKIGHEKEEKKKKQ